MTKAQKDSLMEEFMPDVEEIVAEFDGSPIPHEDLMQEGYLGMVEGVNSLSEDPDEWTGMTMEDQVHKAIRDAIQKAVTEKTELDRRDDQLVVQVELLNKSIDRLTEELGTKPNIDEIANDMGVTQDKVLDILKLTGEDIGDDEKFRPEKKAPGPHRRHHEVI